MKSKITREVFRNLLKPDFDMSNFDHDTFVGLAAEIIEDRELSQKVLGKMAYELWRKGGKTSLAQLATDIEGATGFKVTYMALRSYRWVYSKLWPLMGTIPPEFSYTHWRVLAGTPDPKFWLDKALSEGLSGGQLAHEIVALRPGIKKAGKTVQCPTCGQVINC